MMYSFNFSSSQSSKYGILMNFYYEGAKRGSAKAKFGRSKEKRSDCRLLVLALCINTDGFIRHSEVLPGNTADPKSLPAMVDSLMEKSPVKESEKTLVVIDAGIHHRKSTKSTKCAKKKRYGSKLG